MLRRGHGLMDYRAIAEAAEVIKSGGLAAFPTETVYGLGADAFNPDAVRKIFTAKGRPSDNPLILHTDKKENIYKITDKVNGYAKILMEKFWPGPLTLIFIKKNGLPEWIGGHPEMSRPTAAVRIPSNETALELIKMSGCVVAAPSANKAGTPSPTRAEHVRADFTGGEVGYILDGGETSGGLESTVVDVTGGTPRVLRPGAVTREMLEEALGCPVEADGTATAVLSPGMKYRHYAPAAPVTLVCGVPGSASAYIINEIKNAAEFENKTGILATEQTEKIYRGFFSGNPNIFIISAGNRDRPETIAHNLYGCLRCFDELKTDRIYAEGIAENGLGQAIMNRLKKACEGRIIWTD